MPIESAASRPLALTLRPDPVGTALLGLLPGGGVASADGGYSKDNRAWHAALTFVPAAVVLIAEGGVRLGRLDLALPGFTLAFGCWTLL